MIKARAPRNRTLTCTDAEMAELSAFLLCVSTRASVGSLTNHVINQDYFEVRPFLPSEFVDLLILDPPYNLTKNYNGHVFRSKEANEYISWFDGILSSLIPLMLFSRSSWELWLIFLRKVVLAIMQ